MERGDSWSLHDSSNLAGPTKLLLESERSGAAPRPRQATRSPIDIVARERLSPPRRSLSMTGPRISARGLGRRIDARWLWRHLDLDVAAGEALAITGPSGSGKTLLLRTLAGLEPATEGEIGAEGRSLGAWSMPAYRARVTYVAQRAFTLEGTVEDALRRPFQFGVHRAKPFPRERALQGLRAVGRDAGFLGIAGASLSGGEGQIVALLRALLLDPQVLLLDEPTASLDADTVRAVETLVGDWLVEGDARAVVWTSHQDAQLDRVTQRRVHLGVPP